MQIKDQKKVGDVHVWAIDGGVDSTTHDQFVEAMEAILDQGETKVVLDLTDLTYINSMGLGTLVSLHKRFKKAGAALKFANLHTNVGTVLRFAHLDHLFDLYDGVPEAVRAFDE